ncbi:plasmanylethanolamine desaturase 1-like [Sycon ciliatum]|uniref:plasmanylethanolamine desaturase 1-like n=1 Tax=Sycon ciliatum TaxID=27933 RepID=UPI0020A96205|eukprot:scpid65717/ scgid22146/ Transmembrane protein 189
MTSQSSDGVVRRSIGDTVATQATSSPNVDDNAASTAPAVGAKTELKEAYTQGKRNFEIVSLSSFLLLKAVVLCYLGYHWRMANPIWVLTYMLGGILAADFLSGVVHWLCDSYGSVNMPVFGKAFIRSFREHHVDPTAITRHDVIECNADSCMTMVPVLGFMCYNFALYDDDIIQPRYHLFVLLSWLAFFVAFTNQFHKWSHTYGEVPKWVEVLQDYHVILPKKHHKVHHVAPHATYFCITTGWLNHPLEYIGFWTAIEAGIQLTTGYRAREDDLSWASKPK